MNDIPTLARIKIRLDANNQPVMDGSFEPLSLPSTLDPLVPAHISIIEISEEVTMEIEKKKVEKSIKEASSQLSKFDDGIVVPVIDLSRYLHDQKSVIQHVKRLLDDTEHPKRIGGVLLITNSYEKDQLDANIDVRTPRIIPIANPLAPEEKRLNEKDFNLGYSDESAFSEPQVSISVEIMSAIPYSFEWGIEDDAVVINGYKYAELPKGLSKPLALKQSIIRRTPDGQ